MEASETPIAASSDPSTTQSPNIHQATTQHRTSRRIVRTFPHVAIYGCNKKRLSSAPYLRSSTTFVQNSSHDA